MTGPSLDAIGAVWHGMLETIYTTRTLQKPDVSSKSRYLLRRTVGGQSALLHDGIVLEVPPAPDGRSRKRNPRLQPSLPDRPGGPPLPLPSDSQQGLDGQTSTSRRRHI